MGDFYFLDWERWFTFDLLPLFNASEFIAGIEIESWREKDFNRELA